MQRSNIDRDWLFVNKGLSSYLRMMLMDAQTVHLPHDFTIATDPTPDSKGGSAVGYYNGDIGSYTKYLDIPGDWKNQRVILEIDGAYRNAEVVFNGHLVAKQLNGYFPFHADLTPYLSFGNKNRLTIAVNNIAPYDSRWYSGSGAYRHVYLLNAPQVHLAPWSIFFYTQRIGTDGAAHCMAEIIVENYTARPVVEYVTATLMKDDHHIIKRRVPVSIPPMSKGTARIPLIVENAELWDINHPNLYTIKAELENGDTDIATVGIRTVTVDAKHGFCLNDKTVKLKGGCVHHDNGILGAVSLYDAEYRKLKILKDNGYNAVRCAHNPPSRNMLDACDKLGLMVVNEAFDCWQMRDGGQASDYHLVFESQWKSDMERLVVRDRSHACVIMWSIGNEIMERNGLAGGYNLAAEIAEHTRKLDPTRPLTCSIPSPFNGLDDYDMGALMREWAKMMQEGKMGEGIQNMNSPFASSIWGPRTEPFAAPLDVVGYNYLEERYEQDGIDFPGRVICGEESYPRNIDIIWDKVEQLPYVIGDFAWTAIDYIGEAGLGRANYMTPEEANNFNPIQGTPVNFPWRTANCGDIDICGFPRPQLHYRKIVWGSDETYIAVRPPQNVGKKEIISSWGWAECYPEWTYSGYEGSPISVDVYSRADEVELFLNGQSVGTKPTGKANRYIANFELTYQPGTLLAVSRTENKEVSQIEIVTADAVKAIRLIAEQPEITPDGNALSYVIIELVDGHGRVVPFEDMLIKASVSGLATLVGFGTGRPITTENYTKGEFTSYLGRCIAVVRSGLAPGEAVLKVEAEGLEAAEIIIQLKGEQA